MPTVPIPARRVVTTFDSASKHERIEDKPPVVRLFRRAVSTMFNLWMRVSTPVVEQLGWYDQIEPYVGYGTEAYSRLICRTVYAPEHHRPGARIRGIWGMLAIPAPHRRVRVAIDGTPLETVQVGASESYDKPDAKRRQTAEYAVSDSAGYLDLVAEHRLTPGIHRVSYRVDRRKPVTANLFTIPSGSKVGIISDVDDTIMITQVPTLWKAAYNVLFANPKKRASVPGMSVLFTKLAALFPRRRSSTCPPRRGTWRARSVISSTTTASLPARCCCATWTRAPRPSSPPACSTSSNSPNSSWATSRI